MMERLMAFIGGVGCLTFALFICLGFFTAPADGRISSLAAFGLSWALIMGGVYGLRLAFKQVS